MTPVTTVDKGLLPDPTDAEVGAWLTEHCGRGLPYDKAHDLESALHGAAYTLRQIEGTDQYKVHIGQSGPASSGIRWLLEYVARNEIAKTRTPSSSLSLSGEAVERLGYHSMGSGGRCDWTHLREAVAEATSGSRAHSKGFDPDYYPGHQMVAGINYNSLDRIVTAFVDASKASTPPIEEAVAAERADVVSAIGEGLRQWTAERSVEVFSSGMKREIAECILRQPPSPLPSVLHQSRGAGIVGRPRILDLFCCAGGAAMGYHQAGFDVVGVDLHPQPRYPFGFLQMDALAIDQRFLRTFDAIHASPPCQGYTAMRHAPGAKGAPRLIAAVRTMLEASGLPWIIENVEEARSEMRAPVLLCGSAFGLGSHGCELRRHRLFESSIALSAPACQHGSLPVVGIYGGHARIRSAKHGGRGTRDAWPDGHKPVAAEAMEMDWATLAEMSEAIPPAYTRYIGAQLIAHLQAQRIAA